MKTLSEEIKKFLSIDAIKCKGDEIIYHMIRNGAQIALPEPKKSSEMLCEKCNGNEGFYIPHKKTWSCLNPQCIQINAKYQVLLNNQNRKFGTLEALQPKKKILDDSWQPEDRLSVFRAFSVCPVGFLVLAGENRAGKTWTAQAIFDDFECFEHEKFFISQYDLNQMYLSELERWNNKTSILSQKFIEYKLLVLDDIGTKPPSDGYNDFILDFIDKRHKEKKGTIITTNLTSQLLRLNFGDRFVSRITSDVKKCFKFITPERNKNKWEN